jgi:hypothetical protein
MPSVDTARPARELVTLTDPKVLTTPSSNRFTFTLTASGYRVRSNRMCAAMENIESRGDAHLYERALYETVAKPVNWAKHKKCFPCHQANAKGHDQGDQVCPKQS